jgi:hypothetical protein
MSGRAKCEACDVVRTLKTYEENIPGSLLTKPTKLCATCADTVNLGYLRSDGLGRMLLQINSKLDAMNRRKKEE